jgi:tetratricopeptide (TPR) repeat protein
MRKKYKGSSEGSENIKKFEEMLKNGDSLFFDLDTYEYIINHFIEQGKLKKALKACEMAMGQYPFSTELFLDKAFILIKKQEFEEAEELIDKADLFQPNDIDVIFLKGNLLSQMGDFEGAIQYLTEKLDYVEDKDEIHYAIGMAYQDWGKFNEAIECYKSAIDINLHNEDALYELAYCMDIVGQLDQSIAYYQKFIDNDPYSYHAWYNMGIVYFKLNNIEQAISCYEYTTAINDEFASAWFNMGNCYMNQSKFDKAVECYQKTLASEDPQAETYCNIAVCYERMQQYSKAIEFFRKASKLDPFYDEAYYGIGKCLNLQDKSFEAVHFLKKAIKLDDQNFDYWLEKAEAEYKTGNLVSCMEAYEEACLLNPTSIEIWLNWSFVHFEQGDYDKATSLIKAGIDELPKEAELYYRAAAYLINEGNYKEAFIYLENALILDFEKHTVLFEFFPNLETQKALYKIIDQYRK